MKYLYAQTGQLLQKGSSYEDNEPSVQVTDGDDKDKGFEVSIITYNLNTLRNFTPQSVISSNKSEISKDKNNT